MRGCLGSGIMERVFRKLVHTITHTALALPVTLTVLAFLVLLLDLSRPAQSWRVWEEDRLALAGFHAIEQNETDLFRWSKPQATLFIYGYRGAPALVDLRLAAPRPIELSPAQCTLSDYRGELTQMTVYGDWRRYRLIVPTNPGGESVLRWSTEPYQVWSDARELGLALSEVRLYALASPPLSAQIAQWGLLPLVVWMAGAAWRWPARWRDGLTILAVGPACWLAFMPVAAEYWLPALPWPWWPLAPLAALTGWQPLTALAQRARQWVAPRPQIGWIGLAIALGALLALRAGLALWVGLPLVVIGVWLILPHLTDQDDAISLPTGWLLAGITVIALLSRLVALDQLPVALWRDEARHGLLALRIWSDPTFRPIYVVKDADLPALLFYLMAPVVGLLGPEMWSARLVSALAGALTPLALHWFAAPLIGQRAAVVGAALLAWASWSLSMSRWAFPATLDHALTLTAAGLLWRGLDPDRRGWRPWLDIGLAAGLGGLAVYTYHTGRIAPLALLVVALLRIGRDWQRWRAIWPQLLMAACIGGLVIAPLVWYVLTDLAGFNRRLSMVSIFQSNDLYRHRPLDFLLEHAVRYALMWHWQGEANGRHHLPLAPMIDPVAGLGLLFGLALAWRERQRRLIPLIALWLLYVLPGLFSTDAPHAMRSLGMLAPACALAGWGLSRLRVASSRWQQWMLPMALIFSLSFNLWIYFGLMRSDPRVYDRFDRIETVMAQIARLPAASPDPVRQRVAVYLPKEWLASDTVRFLTANLAQPPQALTAATRPESDAIVILPASANADWVALALTALGPDAVEIESTPTLPAGSEPLVRVFARGAAAIALLSEP